MVYFQSLVTQLVLLQVSRKDDLEMLFLISMLVFFSSCSKFN